MRIIIFTSVFLLLALFFSGCEKDPVYPNWTVYNTLNSGIPNDVVYDIEIDGNQNAWVLTNKQTYLTKFDGTNWRNFEIPGSVDNPAQFVAKALAIDYGNNVWFNLKSDVSLKYTTDSIWLTYNSNDIGLSFNTVQDIVHDRVGNTYFGSSGGLIKFDGTHWNLYNPSNSGITANEVLALAVDIDNSVWLSAMASPFGQGQSGVSHFDVVNWINYNTSNSEIPGNGVLNIAIESNGTKWFGTGHGIAKFDGQYWVIVTTPLDICGCLVKIYIDLFDNIWFCTLNKGLVKYDGTKWTIYDTSNSGIPDNAVNDVAVDTHGNVWVATAKGLSVFEP